MRWWTAATATSRPRRASSHPRAWMRCSRLAGGEALEHAIDALKKGGRVAYPSGVHPVPAAREGLSIVRYDAIAGAEGVRAAERGHRSHEAPGTDRRAIPARRGRAGAAAHRGRSRAGQDRAAGTLSASQRAPRGAALDSAHPARASLSHASCDARGHLPAAQGRQSHPHHRAAARLAVRAAGGGHALGAHHRQERERRHPRALPDRQHARGDRCARRRGREAVHQERRSLQHQGQESDRPRSAAASSATAARCQASGPRSKRCPASAARPRASSSTWCSASSRSRSTRTSSASPTAPGSRPGKTPLEVEAALHRQYARAVPQGRAPLAAAARPLRVHGARARLPAPASSATCANTRTRPRPERCVPGARPWRRRSAGAVARAAAPDA